MPPLTSVEQAFEVAIQFHRTGRLAEAEKLYREILNARPDHAEAMHWLGVIAYQTGRHQQAVDLIRHAIAHRLGAPAHYYGNLGLALKGQGNLDAAIEAYRAALQIDPNLSETHNNLGVVLESRGQRDKAIECFRMAVKISPQYADAHNNLGAALQRQGNVSEALSEIRQSIELNPRNPVAYNNLGNALRESGDPEA